MSYVLLITYVCYWHGLFLSVCLDLFVFRLFVCKTLFVDPGVSGTVVGFPGLAVVLRPANATSCCVCPFFVF